jgi:hypothetical protein
MIFKIKDNYILQSEEIQTANQTATVESYFDMILHSELSFNGGKVTATIFDYLNQPNVYNGVVIFENDGSTVEAQAVNGVASIDFTAPAGTQHTVRTINADMRNGEVSFNV